MITDRWGNEFPNVDAKAFAAIHRRLEGLPPLLTNAEKRRIYATLIEDRYEFFCVLLKELVEDPEFRAALRVALTTEGGAQR